METLNGIVHQVRRHGKKTFITVNDHDKYAQVVSNRDLLSDDDSEIISALNHGDVVSLRGNFKEDDRAPGGLELHLAEIGLYSPSKVTSFNVEKDTEAELGLDTRLNWRFLTMRDKLDKSTFIMLSDLTHYLSEYFHNNDFMRIHTAKLTNSPTEGGTDYFPVEFFDDEMYLSQSPQLYKELVLASGVQRVYEIGPVWRAEQHNTPRHLCEFTSVDAEIAFSDLESVMNAIRDALIHSINASIERRGLGLEKVSGNSFYTMSYAGAKELLSSEYPVEILKEHRLTASDEVVIGGRIKESEGADFVFITHYPEMEKPFYALRVGDGLTETFDLLYKGVEICSGGMREHDRRRREENILDLGLSPEHYGDHLRFFDKGMPPHGGFGMGLNRLTQLLMGLDNVRRATLVPRTPRQNYTL